MFEQMKEYTHPGKLEIYHKYNLVMSDDCIKGRITATFLGYAYSNIENGEDHSRTDPKNSAELLFNTGLLIRYSRIKFEDLGIDTNYYPEEKRRKP